MHWGDDVLLLYLAPFFKPHSPKCGNPTLGVKATQECSLSAIADELKCGVQCGVTASFGDNERGIRLGSY